MDGRWSCLIGLSHRSTQDEDFSRVGGEKGVGVGGCACGTLDLTYPKYGQGTR